MQYVRPVAQQPIARQVSTATPPRLAPAATPVPRLQRALGNRGVGRLIQRYSSGST